MSPVISIEHLELAVTFFAAIFASSGFWLFVNKVNDKRNLSDKLLIGLAHDRIISLGMEYIERGYITQDEYENLSEFLYKPYCDLGGNGSAKRLMSAVDRLPLVNSNSYEKTKRNMRNETERSNV